LVRGPRAREEARRGAGREPRAASRGAAARRREGAAAWVVSLAAKG
jgi:hypothetical protein